MSVFFNRVFGVGGFARVRRATAEIEDDVDTRALRDSRYGSR